MPPSATTKIVASLYQYEYHLISYKQHRQIAGNSCQDIGTALRLKNLLRSTLGKLKGMVRIQYLGIIRSQVLMTTRKLVYGCSSET
jgi:hypothetical protein